MNKKNIIVPFAFLIVILSYVIFQIKFVSYFTIWMIFIFTVLIDALYFIGNQKYSKLLLLLTLISTIMFSSYLYLGINANEPSNVGDFSMLPILLFIVSFPFIIITHSVIIFKIFTKKDVKLV